MAFGKDREVLKQVGSFRQTAHFSQQPRRKTGGGGGGAPHWVNKYQPSTVEPDKIRFLAGQHLFQRVTEDGKLIEATLPYKRHVEHFDGRCNKSAFCSAGPYAFYKDKRDPCAGCDLFWEGGGKKGGRMSRREMYDFSVLVMGKFHEVDQVDRTTGQVKMNETTQKPFTNWIQCGGRKCDACVAGRNTKVGHVQHYPMGYGHFTTLEEYSEIIGKSCSTCRGRDTIQSIAWLCRGCKDAAIDMATTSLDDKEIAKITRESVTCPTCKHHGYLEEYFECAKCTTTGKKPERATIFDVDIFVKRVAGPDGSNQNTLMITGYSDPYPLDPKWDAKPLDLDKIYAPDTMDMQCDKFKVPKPAEVPRQPVTSPAARPYTQQAAPQDQAPAPAAPPPAAAPQAPPAVSRSPFGGGGNMFGK